MQVVLQQGVFICVIPCRTIPDNVALCDNYDCNTDIE